MKPGKQPLPQFFSKKPAIFLWCILLSSFLSAQLNVDTDQLDATYEVGETMTFQISSNSSTPISWELKYDEHAPIISSGVLNSSSGVVPYTCLLYTSPSPRDQRGSRMPSSA